MPSKSERSERREQLRELLSHLDNEQKALFREVKAIEQENLFFAAPDPTRIADDIMKVIREIIK